MAAADTVAGSQFAILVSAVGGYLRHLQDTGIVQAAATSQWQQTIGARISIDAAVVMSTHTRPTSYGPATTIRLIDTAGNLYEWRTTTGPAVRVGDHVAVTGRVRSHDLWQQRRLTQLTRATLNRLPPTPAAAEPAPVSSTVDEGVIAVSGSDLPVHRLDEQTPNLAEVIDLADWLARQGGGIAHTPADLVAWLHERVAAVATDAQLLRHARLGSVDDHYQRFGTLLAAAISDGWARHDLDGVELFERYAHDETSRAQLDAAAGVAAYTAVRADPTLPADEYRAAAVIPAQRQRHLIKAIEDTTRPATPGTGAVDRCKATRSSST